MKIGVVAEGADPRVALVPETVKRLVAKKLEVLVEEGAGKRSYFRDADYAAAGATLCNGAPDVYDKADVIVRTSEPTLDDATLYRPGSALIALCTPVANPALAQRFVVEQKLTLIALDLVPRITVAQSMDVLSSQANIAGYWAVVAAAARLPRYFPMLMTAAGTITPARVLIMGVGVAGLQAIGTAKRLGAVVEATDVRPETKEQVESLGGRFLEVKGVEVKQGSGGYAAEQSDEYKKKQAELVSEAIARADVVITTALIPGRKAPRLVTAAQVASMKPGAVVVDLAAPRGGNVEGTKPGEDVTTDNGVLIMGPANAPAQLATHASTTFSRNVEKLLLHLTKDGAWSFRDDDDVQKGCLVGKDGVVTHVAVKGALVADPPKQQEQKQEKLSA